MKGLFIFFIFIGILLPVYSEEITYLDFENKTEFWETRGEEFPGAVGDFSWKKGSVNIEYDFTQGGEYVSAMFEAPETTDITGLGIKVSGVKDDFVSIRLIDKNDEVYSYKVSTTGKDQKIILLKEEINNLPHWLGDKNNIFDFPIKRIDIGAAKGESKKGVLSIKEIFFYTDKPNEVKNSIYKMGVNKLVFDLNTDKPGNLYYFGENPSAKIDISNSFVTPFETELKLKYTNVYGKEIKGTNSIQINEKGSKEFSLPKLKGWCKVEYSCKIGNETKTGFFTYGFIPDNSKINVKNSYFGICAHFNQNWLELYASILNRVGITWIRDGNIPLKENDRAYEIAKKYNLKYMPTFDDRFSKPSVDYIKEETEKGHSPDSEWDFSPFISAYGEYAKKYGDYVDIYDVQNEPWNYGFGVVGGTWDRGPWLKVLTKWQSQVSKIIKENDPNALILWEDVENFNYSDAYLENDGKDFVDYISNHPYNLHRETPKPEQEPTLTFYKKFWDRNKDNNLNWKLIAGEVGYSTFIMPKENQPMFYAPATIQEQAAYYVRMFFLHFTQGQKRIFPYDLKDDGTNPEYTEHNFGITYFNSNPKPAICAYANAINILDGAKWTGRIDMKDQLVNVFNFTNRNGVNSIGCWMQEGEKTITYPTKSKSVILIDLYGNTTKITPKNNKITLKLTEFPIYIIGI